VRCLDEIERLALKKLQVEPYVYAEWKECKVGLDYHVYDPRCSNTIYISH
jgi:hypothetical protein